MNRHESTHRALSGLLILGAGIASAAGCAPSTIADDATARQTSGVTTGVAIGGFGGKCLDVNGASADNGAKVQLWTCNQTVAQRWTLTNGRLVSGLGKCLDAEAARSANGTRVIQWECNGGPNQQWKVVGDRIIGIGGKCLDARKRSSADGTAIQLWDCHGGDNQKWSVGSPPSTGNPDEPPTNEPGAGGEPSPPAGGGAGAVFEGFDNGFGLLGHSWSSGDGTKAYVDNGIAKIDGTNQGAGLMMFPGGADQCFGNGLFEIRSKLKGNDTGDNSGPANVLWEASNVWPGPEVDIGEIDRSGRVYMATHWKGADGRDAYRLYYAPDGFDQWAFHTYAALLATDKITYMIDGKVIGVETEHPAPDFAHGGENHCIGIMNRSSQTGIEADWVRWTPEASL